MIHSFLLRIEEVLRYILNFGFSQEDNSDLCQKISHLEMKVYEGKDSLRNIYQPYLDEIYSSVGQRFSSSKGKKLVISFYFKRHTDFTEKIANFSLEDTGSKSVLGYSRNSACIVFIISTSPIKLFQNELFNLLNRIHAHTLMFTSAAFVSVKHIKITQTSNC